jgi:hypothetical protein
MSYPFDLVNAPRQDGKVQSLSNALASLFHLYRLRYMMAKSLVGTLATGKSSKAREFDDNSIIKVPTQSFL